jgi:hypothetical protein
MFQMVDHTRTGTCNVFEIARLSSVAGSASSQEKNRTRIAIIARKPVDGRVFLVSSAYHPVSPRT